MINYDEYLSESEKRLIELLKNKSRMEQDQILGELERKIKNGHTLRIDNAS